MYQIGTQFHFLTSTQFALMVFVLTKTLTISCYDSVFLISDQLGRLHMILKPFMLRRVKKDVENELSDKVSINYYYYCVCICVLLVNKQLSIGYASITC